MSGEYYIHDVVRKPMKHAGPQVSKPAAVYKLMQERMAGAQRERFYALMLNTKNRVIRIELVSVGSLNASIVHPREILMFAFGCESCARPAAASIILVHNHPTGDPEPSREDIEFTRRFAKCGDLMGIELLDHIVMGNGTFCSLKEKGYF